MKERIGTSARTYDEKDNPEFCEDTSRGPLRLLRVPLAFRAASRIRDQYPVKGISHTRPHPGFGPIVRAGGL